MGDPPRRAILLPGWPAISRRIDTEVHGPGTDHPLWFVWCGRRYTVLKVLDHWIETGAWSDGEPERHVWIVRTDAGIYELARLADGRWWLYREMDGLERRPPLPSLVRTRP